MILCATKFVFYIFSILFLVQTVFSIDCYECSGTESSHPFQCNEFFDDAELRPISCDKVYGASYCIKHVGRFEGGIGTKRFCSALDLGNYCDYVKQPGDKLEYRSCVYTCTGDGCNSSTFLKPLNIWSVLCSIFVLIFVSNHYLV